MIVDLENSKVSFHKNHSEIEMGFILKSNEILPENLIKLDAGNGDFYVCPAGAGREVDRIIFYGDSSYQFYFYANWISKSDNSHDIEIFSATFEKLHGGIPRVPRKQLENIQKNIEFLFNNRRFRSLNSPARDLDVPNEVIFSWGLAQ